MTSFLSRPFAGTSDIPLLLDFARAGVRARPASLAYWHPGDITWQLWNLGPSEDVRVWIDVAGVAGLAVFEPPLVAALDLRPDHPADSPLFQEILDWAEGRRRAVYQPDEQVPIAYSMLGERTLAVGAFEADADRIRVLEARGYQRSERFGYHYRRGLSGVPAPRLPDGWRLRHVTEADIEERIDLHRDAWSVWGPSGATVEAYRRLRRAPNYAEELDVVLQAPDGRLVSYCICWGDEETGVGEFEPVGTRVGFAGGGFGKLVLYEGMRRLRARGMHTAIVGTASVNERAARLYESVGFEMVGLDRFWVREV